MVMHTWSHIHVVADDIISWKMSESTIGMCTTLMLTQATLSRDWSCEFQGQLYHRYYRHVTCL